MSWKTTVLAISLLLAGAITGKAETFRLETFFDQDDTSCKYTLHRPDWKSHVSDLIREILNSVIRYERLEQAQNLSLENIGNSGLVKFKTVYNGIADSGSGGKYLHEVIEIEGLTFSNSKGFVVKVTNTNHPSKQFLSGKFITCDPMSVSSDVKLSLEDMKKMEINAQRAYQEKLGDAIDNVTGLGTKVASGSLGKVAGPVIEARIDDYVADSKKMRHDYLKTANPAALEKNAASRAERKYFCDRVWPDGRGC